MFGRSDCVIQDEPRGHGVEEHHERNVENRRKADRVQLDMTFRVMFDE
jgi:hypothetical protein